ncbi:MAG TPA: hypothetical protein VMW09_00165 [Desulfatiglandales bacterium]|nr:hypothetical protein [Desulfatiglandales bacterium]
MTKHNLITQKIVLLGMINELTGEQKKEADIILTKFISGKAITDQERKENPKMWAHAEKFFEFGKAPETDLQAASS